MFGRFDGSTTRVFAMISLISSGILITIPADPFVICWIILNRFVVFHGICRVIMYRKITVTDHMSLASFGGGSPKKNSGARKQIVLGSPCLRHVSTSGG